MLKTLIAYFLILAPVWANTGGLVPRSNPTDAANENSGDPMNAGVGQDSQKQTEPAPKVVADVSKTLNRSPAPSVLDIRYHRDQVSGKYIIEEVNPEGPFKHLKGIKETKEEPKPHF